MRYTKHFNTTQTSQSEPIPGSSQVENNAGGFGWEVNNWTKLDRFLVLGTEGGTYYVSEKKLTKDSATAVLACLKQDGKRTVDRIVEISEGGRAPKNDAALFALALAMSFGSPETRRYAGDQLPRVARIGTHLFQFVNNVDALRGWGRGLKRAVGDWYTEKDLDKLAYQVIKYRNREGMTHRDVLRMAHPEADGAHNSFFRWIVCGSANERKIKDKTGKVVRMYDTVEPTLPEIVFQYVEMSEAKSVSQVVNLIQKYPQLPWETIPSEFLGDPAVWGALLPNLPLTAMIRNLGRMSANGLLKPLTEASRIVCEKLSNSEALRKARVHPIALLTALLTYEAGHGTRGKLSWTTVQPVVDALDDAFYGSFGNVEPINKPVMLALDVSGSMGGGMVGGVQGLTPAKAAAAMALITARTEPSYMLFGFADSFRELKISAKARLTDVVKATSNISFGGTDCSIPMLYAQKQKLDVDGFVVYTDSETWAGNIHPTQALQSYRKTSGRNAKEVVVGMVANSFSIADPNDPGQLDVVGFDVATPNVISDFIRG